MEEGEPGNEATSVLQKILLLALHMLTLRLMVMMIVTMVADFCSLVILIHNTFLGEIMISST